MKTTNKNPFNSYKLNLTLSLLIIAFFSIQIIAQDNFSGNKVRTVYVVTSARKPTEISRPRIIYTENTAPKASKAAFDLEKEAFKLINQKRAEFNLKPVGWSDSIANLARQHSLNMANYKFFSHLGLNGSLIDDRAGALGIDKWKAISENIAFNKGFQNPVEFAVERWMLSVGHRQNLLNPRWQQSGVGIAISPDGAYYFTQVFLDK